MTHHRAAGLAAVLLATQATAGAAQTALAPLVTPAELVALEAATDPLVLDIRPASADGEMPSYAAGHIDGAVSAPYPLFRGPDGNPGQVPGEAELTEILRGLGAEADRPTVIVHQGADETDFGAAARVYWTLKSSGVGEIAILNGGVNAWTEAGQPLSDEPVTPEPSAMEVSFSDEWLATAEDVEAVLAGEDEALLLDARPKSFWAGEEMHAAAAKPGTLPQSEYFTHTGWFASGPAIVDTEAARRLAEAEGFAEADQLISFCNTGHWAATNWFALSELAGVENVRLYPESMVGWSNRGGEMANVPSRVQNLWNQIRSTF